MMTRSNVLSLTSAALLSFLASTTAANVADPPPNLVARTFGTTAIPDANGVYIDTSDCDSANRAATRAGGSISITTTTTTGATPTTPATTTTPASTAIAPGQVIPQDIPAGPPMPGNPGGIRGGPGQQTCSDSTITITVTTGTNPNPNPGATATSSKNPYVDGPVLYGPSSTGTGVGAIGTGIAGNGTRPGATTLAQGTTGAGAGGVRPTTASPSPSTGTGFPVASLGERAVGDGRGLVTWMVVVLGAVGAGFASL